MNVSLLLTTVFIILAIVHRGQGQLLDLLFPQITDSTRKLTDAISQSLPVKVASQITGDAISSATMLLLDGPTNIVRAFGSSLPTSNLVNSFNIPQITDNIIQQFKIGLISVDRNLNITQLIVKNDYPAEKHLVRTEDGYLLTMFRIPNNGTAVFLMHGLLGSADDWILNGAESGLAYCLANAGYDVWMGNARGNKHSRRHVELSTDQADFWNFSWHEIGVFDLPAMIDYTLSVTGQDQVKYIGHSQGTTTFFVMTSERPEYNDKINVMVALSPVVFMSKVSSPIVRFMTPATNIIFDTTKLLGVHEFLPDNNIMRLFKSLLCRTGPITEILCSNLLFLIAGFNYEQLNFTNLPVVLSHVPSGSSAKQFAHFGQEILSRKFRQFDYGISKNNEIYGSSEPPEYSLENVVSPVALFYSEQDWLSHYEDVEELYDRLPNVVDYYKIPLKQFNHLDFVFAKDVKKIIYERLERILQLFD